MRRSHYIFADETGVPRPPVYLTAYPLRRRARMPLPTALALAVLILAVLAVLM